MQRKPHILVVGSLVMDLICSSRRFPQSGETVLGLDFRTAPGGKGANQAVQAARLGADVTMVGKVGKDDFGKQMCAALAGSGVHTESIGLSETRPTAIGNIQLEVTEKGTANRILVIPGANMDITAQEIEPLEKTVDRYQMVILQLEIPMEINVQAARIAREHHIPVMLNSAPSALLPEELLRCLTYISPNEHEAYDLTGIPVTDEASAQEAAAKLMEKGVENVLITMGKSGAAFCNRDGFLLSPSVDFGPVADPTAAGDSFVAAFCTAVCLGVSPESAMLFANHTAGITVSRMGAMPSLPEVGEVLAFMRTRGHDTSCYQCLVKGGESL